MLFPRIVASAWVSCPANQRMQDARTLTPGDLGGKVPHRHVSLTLEALISATDSTDAP